MDEPIDSFKGDKDVNETVRVYSKANPPNHLLDPSITVELLSENLVLYQNVDSLEIEDLFMEFKKQITEEALKRIRQHAASTADLLFEPGNEVVFTVAGECAVRQWFESFFKAREHVPLTESDNADLIIIDPTGFSEIDSFESLFIGLGVANYQTDIAPEVTRQGLLVTIDKILVDAAEIIKFSEQVRSQDENVRFDYMLFGTTIFSGNPLDKCLLAFIEELDHINWNARPPVEEHNGSQENLVSVAQQDAKPAELRALYKQLEIALRLQMPRYTIEAIEERIYYAEKFLSDQEEAES